MTSKNVIYDIEIYVIMHHDFVHSDAQVIDWSTLWDDMMASLLAEDEREIKAESNPMTTLSEKQKGTFFSFWLYRTHEEKRRRRKEGREK